MIEIKDVRDLNEGKRKVPVPYDELKEILDYRIKAMELIGKFEIFIYQQYVKNYACFGNGGTISFKELAEYWSVDLPKVPYVGVEKYAMIVGKEKEQEQEQEQEFAYEEQV